LQASSSRGIVDSTAEKPAHKPAPGPFARLVATLDYPVYIVTTAVGEERSGCLIGFATQCSIHPPRFLACISKKNHTFALVMRAAALAVHVIGEKNRDIAELFGGETGDEIDKFARVRWNLVDGVPVLEACERWFVGSVLERIDLGDHMGMLLSPIDVEHTASPEQLTYQQARSIDPGHKP
jgi:flavin reductase (DIM6/NTAB) family NADH-FMN oxidoreductase RutF